MDPETVLLDALIDELEQEEEAHDEADMPHTADELMAAIEKGEGTHDGSVVLD